MVQENFLSVLQASWLIGPVRHLPQARAAVSKIFSVFSLGFS